MIAKPTYEQMEQKVKELEEEHKERMRAEEQLKAAMEYLENVFENSADVIGIVDRNGNFIKWNKMAAELYGYDFEEIKEKSSTSIRPANRAGTFF